MTRRSRVTFRGRGPLTRTLYTSYWGGIAVMAIVWLVASLLVACVLFVVFNIVGLGAIGFWNEIPLGFIIAVLLFGKGKK